MTAATSLREDLLRYDPIVLFHRGNPFHCGEDQFRHEDTLLQDGEGLLRLRHEFLCVRNDFLCHRENRDREPLFLVCGLPRQDVVPVSCVQMQPGDFAVFPLKHFPKKFPSSQRGGCAERSEGADGVVRPAKCFGRPSY